MRIPWSALRGDRVAVRQLVGLPVALVVLWWSFARVGGSSLPIAVDFVVAVLVAVGGAVAVLGSWARLGGLPVVQALRAWMLDGPVPEQVPPSVRLRFLRRHERSTVGFGRLYLVIAGFWLLLASMDVLEHRWSGTVFVFVPTAVWVALGVTTIRFGRRWGDRVEQLVAETEALVRDSAPH